MPADAPSAPRAGADDFASLVAAVKAAVAEQLAEQLAEAAVPQLLTAAEAMAYLGLSKSGFHRAKSAGQLPKPVFIPGSGDRFRRVDLDSFVLRLKPRRKR